LSPLGQACTGAADIIFWTGVFAAMMTIWPVCMLLLIGSEKFKNPFIKDTYNGKESPTIKDKKEGTEVSL
jgi:hypothetical protein